ncbi:MAG: flagellin FliC, partial [Betaproteobacteria bacterium]|nr:flagellin FliC [Betaproteobacteria bacterium]
MALVVNTNIQSLNAQRNLDVNQAGLSTVFQRLSSGLRVNTARDDAAGLAVSEGIRAFVNGSNVGIRNANDGISLANTAEAALGQVTNNLQRIREIAVQAANGTISNAQRENLSAETGQLAQEITRIIQNTSFNGNQLLSGGTALTFQIGAASGSTDQLTVTATQLSAVANAISAGSGLTNTQATASATIGTIDTQLNTVTTSRATFGAVTNRFEAVIANLQVYAESLTAARGRIIDADFAAETASLTRSQILQQASTSVLAQANALPQNALTLL